MNIIQNVSLLQEDERPKTTFYVAWNNIWSTEYGVIVQFNLQPYHYRFPKIVWGKKGPWNLIVIKIYNILYTLGKPLGSTFIFCKKITNYGEFYYAKIVAKYF